MLRILKKQTSTCLPDRQGYCPDFPLNLFKRGSRDCPSFLYNGFKGTLGLTTAINVSSEKVSKHIKGILHE